MMHSPRRGKHNGDGNGNGHGFNLATVAQIFAIPLLTAGGLFFAQWITTGDTLKRHETAIAVTIPQEFKEEAADREKTRTEFLDKLGKLTEGISALNTSVAVMAEQNKQIANTLSRLDGRH